LLNSARKFSLILNRPAEVNASCPQLSVSEQSQKKSGGPCVLIGNPRVNQEASSQKITCV
jgi:hypothetical protein